MNIFLILLLLALQLTKEKKKSSLECFYGKCIEKCKIKNAIIDKKKKINKFIIYLYCMKDEIFIDQEKRLLNLLYKKYGLSWLRYELPDITEILSLKKHSKSTFIFTSKRKEESLFFY